jgi:putative transposase
VLSYLWGARSLLGVVTCVDMRIMASGMMIGCISPSALPGLRADLRLAGPARPVNGVRGHRAAGAATRGCRAAPHPSPAPRGLGRSGGPLRAHPASATAAAGAPTGHARHRPTMAPPPGHKEVGAPDRTGRPPISPEIAALIKRLAIREQQLGIPADPGRAAQAWLPGQRIHDPPRPRGP